MATRAESAASELERRIVSGDYAVGARLPNEIELADSLGVSRTTLRDAVGRLQARGLVAREQGRGTFVRRTAGVRISMLLEANLSISDMIREMGLAPATSYVTTRLEVPPAEVALALGRSALAKTLVIRRVRTADGVPAVYSTDYLVVVPGLPLQSEGYWGSLYELLHNIYGRPVASGHARLRAGQVTGQLAQRLGVPEGSLAVELLQVHQLGDGTPVMFSRVHLRNDVFSIYVRRVSVSAVQRLERGGAEARPGHGEEVAIEST